ncbi:MAG: ADP-ribosyltransferase [Oscillospiraceae bacterium]
MGLPRKADRLTVQGYRAKAAEEKKSLPTLDNGGGSGIIKEKEEKHDYHYLSKEEFDKLGVSQITPQERQQAYSHRVIDSNGNNIQEGGYIRTSNSFSINKSLRNGDLSSLSDDDKLTISTLEGIMDNNPSKVDIMVDRYTDPNYIRKNFGIELKRFNTQSTNSCMQEILNNHINECIQENGFISTSWNPEENVFKDSRPVQLVISIPQGTPMYITDNSDESEIILKRGTKFKVTNCDTTQNDEGDDLLRFFLEVIKE